MSTEEGSGQVPGKGRIRASVIKVEFGRVPKKGPGEYRERVRVSTKKVGSGRVQEKGPGEYRERVESGRVPEK